MPTSKADSAANALDEEPIDRGPVHTLAGTNKRPDLRNRRFSRIEPASTLELDQRLASSAGSDFRQCELEVRVPEAVVQRQRVFVGTSHSAEVVQSAGDRAFEKTRVRTQRVEPSRAFEVSEGGSRRRAPGARCALLELGGPPRQDE